MTYTRAIGIVFGAAIDRIVRWLALSHIHPNVLTFLGLVINIVAAYLFAAGSFRWAGAVVIGAGLFDMVDGRVARETKSSDSLRRLLRLSAGPLFRPGLTNGPAGLLRFH